MRVELLRNKQETWRRASGVPVKRWKNHQKRKKYEQKFITKYNDIPGIQSSLRKDTFAYCSYCRQDFCIGNSGMYDIKRHRGTDTHKKLEKESKGMQSIASAFKKPGDLCDLSTQTTAAEAVMTDLIVNLNLPITAADKTQQNPWTLGK